jgi:hypothetical protein
VRSIRARLTKEDGWGLVSSILVVGILISLSLPLLSLVDTQQSQSAHERKSESSFNLAEAALDAAVFSLGKHWPATDTLLPETCTEASTHASCPSGDILTRTYAGGDYTDRGWTVQIRDDNGSEYYDSADIPDGLRYDANDNSKVWVRADAHAADGDRTIIALVRRIDSTIPFPRNAITAGWFVTSNEGNKVIVDPQGGTVQAAPVAVRCTLPPPSPRCLDYRPGQVAPDTTTPSYAGTTAIAPEILEMFRARARALDSYYPSGCPSDPEGALVFVERGNCRYTGGRSANSADAPGMFIVGEGTISFGGGMTYYGLVYAANLQGSTDVVVRVHGGATIVGSIAADGSGGVEVGSSGKNLIYADAIFPLISTFSGAAQVQGSWRELPAS